MRKAREINLDEKQKAELSALERSGKTAQRLAQRCRIVLAAGEGMTDKAIGKQERVSRQKAGRWRKRYLEAGLAGLLKDKAGRGRPARIKPEQKAEVVRRTLEQTPEMATQWSTRRMARESGMSASSVALIWQAHGLKPHLARGFKLSKDKHFLEKLEDVVGLYLNAPEHALVLSCDEKSQIQALDRSQPGLPLRQGRVATQTHDYKRHGTTTLFAALNLADGKVIGSCQKRHRHQEWLRFLRLIDASTPPEKPLHLIVDNYSTHKHEKVRCWLAKHPRFHLHFTPTSASWLNMVERFFRDLTVNRLRRGIFKSLDELHLAIDAYLAAHNRSPKPFIWTAKASDILAKVQRARAAQENT
ncbi:MAG: IS630 family transposase [Opitutaceae bacterium]|jgi:transposase|nr:IS630 family transposase [Opitutaceae bacterium]